MKGTCSHEAQRGVFRRRDGHGHYRHLLHPSTSKRRDRRDLRRARRLLRLWPGHHAGRRRRGTFASDIASDAANIGAALRQARTLAPSARVYVVGYPDILPRHGNCWPQMPLTTGDVTYLNGVENDLNTMLQQQASASGATFIDTYDPGTGHDACQPESSRWIEPIIPATDAAPVHPNAAGEAAMASIVETAIGG
jgi:hypothetical protein